MTKVTNKATGEQYIVYQGFTMDPQENYFGPQDNPINDALDSILGKLATPEFRARANEVAFEHDIDYRGKRRKGLWGLFRDYMDRKAYDRKFLAGLRIASIECYPEGEEQALALKFSKISHSLIRKFGWVFYKTGEAE